MITVEYTCGECDLKNVKLNLPSRLPYQPIGPWMRGVAKEIQADHKVRRPKCKAPKIGELKIPLNADPESPVGSEIK